ncbi:MAG: HD domain-containing protein [Candidatus Hermodarchaeia archaeon]|jgi:putative hydrolase of HD superfamily
MTLFQFLTIFDDLKQVLRTGWLLRGVPPSRAENVAAHSHTTAILAYLLALQTKESVDLHQVLLMALIHDAPEAVIGDIPMSAQRADPEIREAKKKAEDNAMNQILTYLPAELQPTVSEAWSAYRKRTSLEARLVEAADRLATALHAAQLVKSGFPVEQFQPFIDHAEKTVEALHIPQAKDFIKELREVFPQKL